ncbi:threonine--tRNA ligase [Candidatus Poribacteria bacterium]|nr:threonine--tRNA ligase [Candidatus Poribacteria bacterium]
MFDSYYLRLKKNKSLDRLYKQNLRAYQMNEPNQPEDYLQRLRHSTAHIMAYAVQQLFPDGEHTVKLAIGPPIENEFYYDMEVPRPITPDDFPEIEKHMKAMIKSNVPFVQETWTYEQAREWFAERNQKFKLELIDGISDQAVNASEEGVADEGVSIYHNGDFTDLCKGPHVEKTRECRHFKLLRVSGAYWRGDSNREQLQRIYGTAWETKDDLQAYLKQREEAAKRDHRKLGRELELFQMHPESPGSVFWLPKGAFIYNHLSEKVRKLYLSEGYQEVRTPLIYDSNLWQTSGHWEHFKDDMFLIENEEGEPTSALKPMNCPAHMLIYKSTLHSYRDLPYRLYDQGVLHRNEATGTLSGLSRVRQLCQDDAHIFIPEDQNEIADEYERILELFGRIYGAFDLPFRCDFSTRNPEKYMGDLEVWNKAEDILESVLKNNQIDYSVNPGEAAFYGPKLDFQVRDSLNRDVQCATVQLDFQLPERFELTYIAPDGSEKRPVVIHRAICGSFERFIAMLIEHYAGAFPTWLSPVQCTVMTISQKFVDYATEVQQLLIQQNCRVVLDNSDDKIGAKIRQARLQRIPYMLIIGEREQQNRTVSVRSRDEGDIGAMDLDSFVERISREVDLEF